MRSPRPVGLSLLGVLLLGCPGRTPQDVVYDLADAARHRRALVQPRRDALRHSRGRALPDRRVLSRGPGAGGERFVVVKAESEVPFTWAAVGPRRPILDVAPYRGVRDQSGRGRLNGTSASRGSRSTTCATDTDHAARRGAEGRGTTDCASCSRAHGLARGRRTRSNPDRAPARGGALLPGDRAGLRRSPGRPAGAATRRVRSRCGRRRGSARRSSLLGPSVVRYALRLPPRAELRFTPMLHPAARAAAGGRLVPGHCSRSAGEELRALWYARDQGAGDRRAPRSP